MKEINKRYMIYRVIGLVSLILSSGLSIYIIILTRPDMIRTFKEIGPDLPFVLSTLFLVVCILVPIIGIAKEWLLKDHVLRATLNAVLIFISLLLVVIYAFGIYYGIESGTDWLSTTS